MVNASPDATPTRARHAAPVQHTVVVQRQTLDWHTLTDADFAARSAAFCRMWGRREDYIMDLKRLWDTTFGIDYFETRHRTKQIALDNIAAVPDITFVPYADYRNIPDLEGCYVFIDDDDWLSPRLHEALIESGPFAHPFRLWRTASIGSPNQEQAVFLWGCNGRCMTNNYAVSADWLDGLRRLPEVVQHGDAVRTLRGLEPAPQLDQLLSATNKSPCSSVALERGLHGHWHPAALRALVGDYVRRMHRVPESQWQAIAWAREYVDATIALFEAVLASARP